MEHSIYFTDHTWHTGDHKDNITRQPMSTCCWVISPAINVDSKTSQTNLQLGVSDGNSGRGSFRNARLKRSAGQNWCRFRQTIACTQPDHCHVMSQQYHGLGQKSQSEPVANSSTSSLTEQWHWSWKLTSKLVESHQIATSESTACKNGDVCGEKDPLL